MKTIFFLLVFSIFSLAAKPIASFSATPSFSGEELFLKLDEVGKNGNWMRYDTLSISDPVLEKVLKKHKDFLAAWVINSPDQTPKMAVLSQVGKQEKLSFYEVDKINTRPEMLSVHAKLFPELVLSDYQGVSTNEFVHKDDPALKLKIDNSSLYFSYTRRDKTPLRFDGKFASLSFEEKAKVVAEYKDFFLYEYVLMLRAFIQSTRGIFNWQAWHWYMPEWNQKYFISSEEISAILSSGYPPAKFRIFSARTSRQVLVEMHTDGNGFYEMNIRMP